MAERESEQGPKRQQAAASDKMASGHGVVADVITNSPVVVGDHNRVEMNVTNPAPAGLREAYLQYVLSTARRLSLEGVDPKAVRGAEEDRELSLDGVYTGLRVLDRESGLVEMGDASGGEQLRGKKPAEPGPALAALDAYPRLVLLGDPGSGKSTFVAFVSLCLAAEGVGQKEIGLAALTRPLPAEDDNRGEEDREPQKWSHGALLPVRVVLRDFAARGLPPMGDKATAKHLLDFIHQELASCCEGDFTAALDDELRNKGALVLLDGLDEVPEADKRRDRIKGAIDEFGRAFPKCRLLVTSRTYAYRKQGWRLPRFEERELAPFSPGQVAEFVRRWYAQVDRLRRRSAEDSEGRARLLLGAIRGSPRLAELAARPLLLTLMASLHAWRGGTLPQRREELYSDAVDLLLERWEAQRTIRDKNGKIVNAEPSLAEWLRVDRERVRELLEESAFLAHQRQPELLGTADVPANDLIGGLLRLTRDPDLRPGQLIEYLSAQAGILLPRGEAVFTFPHRTFQEYLAACHLTRTDYPSALGDLVRADPERWREVALLAGAKAGRGSPFALWALVEDLVPEGSDQAADGAAHYSALIAGQALAESADVGKVAKKDLPKLARTRRRLCDVLAGDTLPAKLRAEAGDAVAVIGDPRFRNASECCLPADEMMGFVEIPDGPFLMGEDREQHQVGLRAFWMARFPVTVAQFRAFVQATGRKPEDEDGLRTPDTRPMTYVSLDEALGYCAWLDSVLRLRPCLPDRIRHALDQGKVTLPSEAEWEKAARGTDGRTYPWGDEWNSERANVEMSIGRTSAVGCFPRGSSPRGCEDMIGNVWEWTRSRYEHYPYPADAKARAQREAPGGEDRRVVRGASFSNDPWVARAACRSLTRPAGRGYNLGFRVVVSPSVSDP
jgi:formylglycine-generating enzyme required for sulfatase activity